ncbi:metal ABC transporter solute-binding protein, Zn/Mn family [Parapusillimonas granuli]|uniref:Zinc ABC transporter substrate-binding protein n=1 Tax=Parapusillimonas granuli TaxID=380911 RepID=A0A853G596_9BURK|nr:zinc ABC transporter substrate-binding protein [Parapusillimonas granuli]MBB5215452.1 zinc/manganese transport system substrate-binding protein [Parapusillimonas granuli]NYT49881.1 zinc ABC transporter substrate-binding protein [Parapusillimonas granuli]
MSRISAFHDFRPLRRLALTSIAAGFVAGLAPASALAQPAGLAGPPLKVVASFSILGDMVREIGGEHVSLTTIVGPDADAHTFEPSPKNVQALAKAQVLVLNGLDFEPWLPRLVESAGFKGLQVLASKGVPVRHLSTEGPREHAGHAEHDHDEDHDDEDHDEAPGHGHAHGDVDPHAWQSLSNGMIYAANIADGLGAADPARRAYYKNRARLYIEKMKKLDAEIKLALSDVPKHKRKVISSHDAFGYFADAYGIQFLAVTGISNQAEPSAREVAALIDRVRRESIAGVFIENAASPKLVEQIARETGAKVGGTLYSDALAKADQPASSYLGMFTWNAGQLIYVLKSDVIKPGGG